MPKGQLLNRYSSTQAFSVFLENILRNLVSKIEPKEWRRHKIGVLGNFLSMWFGTKSLSLISLPETSWVEKIP